MDNAPIIIVRGAPGAGKSTFAERIRGCGSCFIFETDNFFVDSINHHDYHFDSKLLGIAHSWNQGEVIRACRDCPTVPIVVANTFCQNWELKPYLEIAKAFNRKVIVFTLRTEHDNVHGVPDSIVQRHRLGLQEFVLSDWKNMGPGTGKNGDYPIVAHYTIMTDAEAIGFAQNAHNEWVVA